MAYSIAGSFTSVVTSFVSDILLPPLSLLPFINRNMDEKFAILRRGPKYNVTDGVGYNTLRQAADDGAVVLAYGYVSIFHVTQLVLENGSTRVGHAEGTIAGLS